ncbi:MAG: hypothetical protein IJS60_09040 [Abditibacteriota bacterium]|nr:hypothetical protein [Abditibacteriota bacterium]
MKKLLLPILLLFACSSLFASILTDYVYNDDGTYKYNIKETKSENGINIIVVDMVSQTWQDVQIKNTVVLLVPDDLKIKDTAVLLNTGGSYDNSSIWASLGGMLAKLVSVPICIVFDIPNQPMWDKKEDALMSWTFKQALDDKDFTKKPLLLQMAKAVIKSMDTIEEVSKEKCDTKIDKFIITGASKRGWTSWISAGTKDKRIIGIMPIVFDFLDMKEQLTHQKEYYGDLSIQIGDYTELNFDKIIYTPEAKTLLELIDPFYYDIDIPKLIINGTNDPYWTLDSSSIYYPKLKGEKYLFYKPNAGHDMGLLQFVDEPVKGFFEILPMLNVMKTFIYHLCLKDEMENIEWAWTEKDNKITCELNIKAKPARVISYTTDVDKRDFRGVKWEGVPIEPNEEGKYIFTREKPEKGWSGSYIEVKFVSEDNTPYSVFTTPYVSK